MGAFILRCFPFLASGIPLWTVCMIKLLRVLVLLARQRPATIDLIGYAGYK
jgi:hypothetical protein